MSPFDAEHGRDQLDRIERSVVFLPQPLRAPHVTDFVRYLRSMPLRSGCKDRDRYRSAGARWAQARETAWDYLAQEAVRRAGRGTQIKGVIHEMAIRERSNLTLKAFLSGQRTNVTRSANARTVDLVTTRNGRIVERIQAKDCVSDACARNVQARVEAGQYRTARLVGTRETAAKLKAAGVTKSVRSSGVSSRSTTRAADNAGAKVPNRNLVLSNAMDVAGCAGRAGVTGGVLGAGAEALGSLKELRTGQIDGAEYAHRIAVTGAKATVDSTVRTTIALGAKEAVKAVGRRAGAEGLKRLAGSNAGTAVAFGFAELTINTVQLFSGKIDRQEYGMRTVQTTGSTGGAIGGAAAGAAIGSVIPGAGTVVGAVVGGIAGSLGGGGLGRELGNLLFGD